MFLQDDNQNDSTVWYLLSQIYKAMGNTEGMYKSTIEWVGYFQGISSDKSLMHQRHERNKGCILETSERKKKTNNS